MIENFPYVASFECSEKRSADSALCFQTPVNPQKIFLAILLDEKWALANIFHFQVNWPKNGGSFLFNSDWFRSVMFPAISNRSRMIYYVAVISYVFNCHQFIIDWNLGNFHRSNLNIWWFSSTFRFTTEFLHLESINPHTLATNQKRRSQGFIIILYPVAFSS